MRTLICENLDPARTGASIILILDGYRVKYIGHTYSDSDLLRQGSLVPYFGIRSDSLSMNKGWIPTTIENNRIRWKEEDDIGLGGLFYSIDSSFSRMRIEYAIQNNKKMVTGSEYKCIATTKTAGELVASMKERAIEQVAELNRRRLSQTDDSEQRLAACAAAKEVLAMNERHRRDFIGLGGRSGGTLSSMEAHEHDKDVEEASNRVQQTCGGL